MVAIAGGLGAAASWAFATLASSRSSRMIGAFSVIGWVMLVGFLAALVPAALTIPHDLQPELLVALVVVGLSYNAGLLLTYAALTVGRVSIVAPITATEGAIAAVASVALGEPLALSTAILLAAIAVGVVLAAFERAVDVEAAQVLAPDAPAHDPRRAAGLALAAAAAFSVGLVVAGRLGEAGVPPTWVVGVPRAVGVLGVTLPLLALGRLRLARPAAPLVVFSGLLEALGSGLYVVAAKDGVALAAVLGSQFAAIAAVGGFVVFGERLQRIQVLGVAIIAVGVAGLAATQA
jgi:drug/metabolite transporter (DMT)-like permease